MSDIDIVFKKTSEMGSPLGSENLMTTGSGGNLIDQTPIAINYFDLPGKRKQQEDDFV